MNKCNRVLCRVFGLISVFSFGLCLSISRISTTHVHAESIDYASNFDLLNNSNNSAYYNASSCQPNKVSYTSIDTKGINRFYFSWLDDDLNVTNFYHPNISEYAGYTIMAHSNFITFDATHNYVYVVGEDNSSPGTYRYDLITINENQSYSLTSRDGEGDLGSEVLDTNTTLSLKVESGALSLDTYNTGTTYSYTKSLVITSLTPASCTSHSITTQNIYSSYASYGSDGTKYEINNDGTTTKLYIGNDSVTLNLDSYTFNELRGIDVYSEGLYLAFQDATKYYQTKYNTNTHNLDLVRDYTSSVDYYVNLFKGKMYLSASVDTDSDSYDDSITTINMTNDPATSFTYSNYSYLYNVSFYEDSSEIYGMYYAYSDLTSLPELVQYKISDDTMTNSELSHPSDGTGQKNYYFLSCSNDGTYIDVYDLINDKVVRILTS